jgi:hypothetical protein
MSLLNINLGWIMEGLPPHLITKVSKYFQILFSHSCFGYSMMVLLKFLLYKLYVQHLRLVTFVARLLLLI